MHPISVYYGFEVFKWHFKNFFFNVCIFLF
jgi:hypothetical protein